LDKKRKAAIMAALMRHYEDQKPIRRIQALTGSESNVWGMLGRQEIMNGRKAMQMRLIARTMIRGR
jgi:hypothetical protein